MATISFELLRWRHDLVATFLRLQPGGRLSAAVRAASERWYVALVAPAALAWLAGRAVVTVARELALGFEQTQKALAFVFRQRIERQAERSGYAEGTVADLSPEVLAAFTEDPIAEGELVVDQFPGLSELPAALSAWHDTGVGGSFLVTGERGIGKTSWLNQLQRDDMEIVRIELGGRVIRPEALARRLGELLVPAAERPPTIDQLADVLLAGPRQVVVLDVRFEKAFETDVTERVVEGLREAAIGRPALLHRTVRAPG